VVPYGDSADFYYSGHTGFMLMSVLQLYRYNYKKCAAIAFFVFLFVV
jgi:hypothetical protein